MLGRCQRREDVITVMQKLTNIPKSRIVDKNSSIHVDEVALGATVAR